MPYVMSSQMDSSGKFKRAAVVMSCMFIDNGRRVRVVINLMIGRNLILLWRCME